MSANKYEEILNRPYKKSDRHPRMPLEDRAAQFAPFAALSGYGEKIREARRLTEEFSGPGEEETRLLNEQTAYLAAHLKEHPEITVTYFEPDAHKEGGCFLTCRGSLRRIDETEGFFVFTDGRKIRTKNICSIDFV